MTRYSPLWDQYGKAVEQLVQQNTPMRNICNQTNLSHATISKWIKNNGWAYIPSTDKISTKTSRATEEVLALVDEGIKTGKVDIAAIAKTCNLGFNSVRRIIQRHRETEWQATKDVKYLPKEKTCTKCNEKLPLSEFPERTDRIGKVHAYCSKCRIDWARQYRHENPIPIREASRRRRARIRGSRTEKYAEIDIYIRDNYKCWFCQDTVDITLRYPDPNSPCIHHIHPIAKGGPDITKNVALAHLECNHQAKDKYDPIYRYWSVAPISSKLARELVTENHYLHRSPTISFAYGLFDEQNNIWGVVTFGSPSSMRISRSVCDDYTKVIELNRLWINDSAPFGIGSWMISKALKQLPPYIVVAYADLSISDSRYKTNHDGAIYRACSFYYGGTSKPNTEWRLPDKSRNVGKNHPGAIKVSVSPKRRFWTVTGNKSEKRNLKVLSKWSILTL